MAGTAIIHQDSSWLSRVDQGLHRIETLLIIFSGLAVAGLVVLAVLSVSGRFLFNQPLAGYIDWIQQFMPVIAFTGISYALRNGTHIRMDMLINKAKGRQFYAAEFISTLLIFALMLFLLWGSYTHFSRSFDLAQPLFSRDSSIDIGLPLWPAKLLIPVSFAIMVLRAIIQLFAYAKAFLFNNPLPVAIPLTQSIEQQAEHEAAKLGISQTPLKNN